MLSEAIAAADNFQEELEAEICRYGESYGIDGKTMLDMIKDEDKEALEQDMLVRAAMKLIEDTAILTDSKAE